MRPEKIIPLGLKSSGNINFPLLQFMLNGLGDFSDIIHDLLDVFGCIRILKDFIASFNDGTDFPFKFLRFHD
jgi:hypothetical protein